ncbi:probable transcription regulator NMA0738 [Dickeya aquatica]|uniref:Probable transcription regulator NMA0738 n=1 Tax=Dickeya aquatica TaxID=1401087 RepID=A0A375A997_9GAMM|nr:probable transcription regulator NMA0738 [Dickeya aquatica]
MQWLSTGETDVIAGQSTEHVSNTEVTDSLGNLVDIDEFVFIPRYNVRAAAGFGALNEEEEPSFTMAFRRYWIENYLNVDYHKLFVIRVDGTSLSGLLNDGDVILVNGGDTDPKEGIYVLRMDGHLLVKLVQRLPGNILSVSSTDPLFTPFTINMAEFPDDLAIIGKVVWFGRTI